MTENEKTELFDKWYDENYDEWAEGEEGIALREELEQAFKGGIAELENKIADIKANCDLAIEGRDIKIKELELELTVEKDQHQEEINLHLHAEDYIKSLEKENKTLEGCLLAEQENTQMLEQQIEKMKNWCNCKNYQQCLIELAEQGKGMKPSECCVNCKKWEIEK